MARQSHLPNSNAIQGSQKGRRSRAGLRVVVVLALAAALCAAVALEPSPRTAQAVTPTVLYFHGNTHDSGGGTPARPCTGDGRTDVNGCGGPYLSANPVLDTAPAARWETPSAAADGTVARNLYDPNWVWNSGPVRLGGEMSVDWWASCSACGPGIGNADWMIRVWADGVKKFEQRVRATPDLPNVPKLLTTKVFLPEIVANQNVVLQVDPVFIDTQNNTIIYYDSQAAQTPCPGATAGSSVPCNSRVTMPVLAPGEPVPTPTPDTAGVTYIKGGIEFSPSVPLHAPATVRDGEPSIRVDKFGNTYVAGIRGVPAGCDLWYFDLRPTVGGQPNPNYDPFMRNPAYRGQPDAFSGEAEPSLLADGGGDVDLAVSFPESDTEDPANPPTLSFTSLALANISVARSKDRGVTFEKNPAGNVTGGLPIDDRQWFEAVGPNTVYLLYRTVAPAVSQIQRSNDGGLTFGPARTAGAIGQVGYIDVHKATGTVYVSGSSGQVCVGTPATPQDEPLTYSCKQAGPTNGANLFFVVKVADDGTPNGTAYVNYSDGTNIYLAYSTDKGQTWSKPVRINDGPETAKNLLPWMETGPVPGSVGVVWYGTANPDNNNNADWNVFFAQVTGANTPNPVIRQVKAGDHVHHASNISLAGLNPTATDVNRNLIDYFQVAFDPTGAAVIAYTDDHNDYDGNTFVTRQISGPNINGGSVPAPVEGSALPPPAGFDECAPQVTDFALDARSQTAILHIEEAVDITSIKYSTEGSAANPVLVTQMKVSGDLSTLPPAAIWRVNFAANAPNSVMSPTGLYTFGTADRGDQFYMQAQTDAAGARTYRFGTAARNGNGGMTYTDRGAADFGSFDPATKTVTLKVALSKLNPFVKAGNPALGPGTVLTGLRGQANIGSNASGRDPRSDATRGGTQYVINRAPTAALAASPAVGGPVLTVNFDASGSSDPDASCAPLSYRFDFGDGSPAVTQSSPTAEHTYTQLGTYTATVTVTDASGFQSNVASASVEVIEPGVPLSDFALATPSTGTKTVWACRGWTGQVILSAPAPAGGQVVKIENSHPKANFPESVTVPEGMTSAHFNYTADAVTPAEQLTAQVVARSGGVSVARNLTVRPIGISSVTLSPQTVRGGQGVQASVSLECGAAPGPVDVKLVSLDPRVADVELPETVTLQPGQTTATFNVTTYPVALQKKVTLRATANGSVKNATLTVNP